MLISGTGALSRLATSSSCNPKPAKSCARFPFCVPGPAEDPASGCRFFPCVDPFAEPPRDDGADVEGVEDFAAGAGAFFAFAAPATRRTDNWDEPSQYNFVKSTLSRHWPSRYSLLLHRSFHRRVRTGPFTPSTAVFRSCTHPSVLSLRQDNVVRTWAVEWVISQSRSVILVKRGREHIRWLHGEEREER